MKIIAPIVVTLVILSIILVSFWIYRKMRNAHLLLYKIHSDHEKDLADLFHQIQALQGLYLELKFEKSLPSTRGWAASPDFLLLVVQHALDFKPQVVVECGSGVSTLVLARALQINGSGHVYSLEHQYEYAHKTKQLLERHGLTKWATVLHASLRLHDLHGEEWPWYSEEVLPNLVIDMLVIDGPPGTIRVLARYPAGPILFDRLNSSAMIFLDDANREDERKILSMWTSEFPQLNLQFVECEKGCAIMWKKDRTSKETV